MTEAIPDGCIDILFDCDTSAPNAQVCGSLTRASKTHFHQHHRYFGLRFSPGFMPDFLAISAHELVNNQFQLLDVVPESQRLFDAVVSQPNFACQVALMNLFLYEHCVQPRPRVSTLLVAEICRRLGNLRLHDLEIISGCSGRTLQRVFKQDIGMSPKEFSRVIRCQSVVHSLNHERDCGFSDLAFKLGFSDQSHLLREFKKQMNTTPGEYQKRIQNAPYLEKIQYC